MAALIRTRTGRFTLDEAVTIEKLDGMTPEERLGVLKPVESLFDELPALELDEFHARLIRCGSDLYQKKLRTDFPAGTLIRLRRGGAFFALGRAEDKPTEGGDGTIPAISLEKLFVLEES